VARTKDYYVIPEHHMFLSDDRTELVFEQHLPDVRREQLNVEVLEQSICLEFTPEGGQPVSRCYGLPYHVVPSEAKGKFAGGRLEIRVRLRDALGTGSRLELL
jgi:HSP20 family molecular chaperone IbpA